GVTFFLTGAGASVQLSGQADWHIVAPTGGPLPGFAIFLDPRGPTGLAGDSSQLSGQAELYFEGIVYLPQQQVTVSGNGSAYAPSPYTSYIGDTLRFVGNGDLIINNDTSLTKLPIPTALMVQTGGQMALAQYPAAGEETSCPCALTFENWEESACPWSSVCCATKREQLRSSMLSSPAASRWRSSSWSRISARLWCRPSRPSRTASSRLVFGLP